MPHKQTSTATPDSREVDKSDAQIYYGDNLQRILDADPKSKKVWKAMGDHEVMIDLNYPGFGGFGQFEPSVKVLYHGTPAALQAEPDLIIPSTILRRHPWRRHTLVCLK